MRKRHPRIHAESHKSGGVDEIDISGLTPASHASRHENGGADEISLSGLSGQQIIVPYNADIVHITHADTNKHTLNLATLLPETRKIIAVNVAVDTVSGSGNFYVYPNEGDNAVNLLNIPRANGFIVIKDGTNRLQYSLGAINDSVYFYCYGYVVVGA